MRLDHKLEYLALKFEAPRHGLLESPRPCDAAWGCCFQGCLGLDAVGRQLEPTGKFRIGAVFGCWRPCGVMVPV